MVSTSAAVALVVGLLLALIGGLGTLVVLVGTLAGVLDWGLAGWVLLLALVGGTGLATYGVVTVADDLVDAIWGGGLSELTENFDTYRLRQLLD